MEKKNIYEKLSIIRTGIKNAQVCNFKELLEVVDKKTKYHKVLPLYYSYGEKAVLRLVNMDDVADSLSFEVGTGGMSVRNAKRCLYQMAFDVDSIGKPLTLEEYAKLFERMKAKGVTEKEILERYKVESAAELTKDIYDRCMTAFDNMTGGKG